MSTAAASVTSTPTTPPGAFACGVLQQALCFIYICNGRAIQREVSEDAPTCTLMGDSRREWSDARRYCREYGGALYTSAIEPAATYKKNGVSSLWSGYYKQNNQVLQETPTTPVWAPFEPDLWRATQPVILGLHDLCAMYTYTTCSLGSSAGETSCQDSFQLVWNLCGIGKANFACDIPARPLTSLHIHGNQKFTPLQEMGYHMFFSSVKSAQTTAQSACQSVDPKARVFSISNSADRAVLKFVASNARLHGADLGLSQHELRTALFWVDDPDTKGCEAIFLGSQNGQGLPNSHMMIWPCRTELRVLCKSEDLVHETKPPIFFTHESGDFLKKTQNAVFVPLFYLIRTFHGMSAEISIGCRASLTSERQNLTLYIDDKPVASTKRREQDGEAESEFIIGESFLLTTSNHIDLVGHYHCEVNDLKTRRVLQSNRIFIQPIELEIYVVVFRLKQPSSQQDWQELSHLLEFNDLTSRSGAGLDLLVNLTSKVRQYGDYTVKPLALKSRSRSLVTYVYNDWVDRFSLRFGQPASHNTTQIQQFANETVGLRAGSLEIESVKVMTLDDCLATNTRQLPIPDACG